MRYRGVGSFASATLISRILGLIRESTIAYILGASNLSDAFYVAFRIPNIFRDIFAENAVQAALIPAYFRARENRREAQFLGSSLLFFGGVTLIVSLLGILFSNVIVTIFAYGFKSNPEKFNVTVRLTRITFPYLWLISLAAFVGGVLNIYRRFFVPALGPVFFNIGVIATALIGYGLTGSPLKSLFFIALGVLVGGALHLLFQIPFLIRERPAFKFRGFKIPEFNMFLKLLSPVFLNTGFSRLTLFVNTFIASFLGGGAISYLNFAFRLMQLPIGLFGVGVSTVVNPDIAEKVARREDPADVITEGIRLTLILTLPFLAIFIADARGVIDLIYKRGNFGETALMKTSLALIFYSLSIVPVSISKILLQFFYAKNTIVVPNRVFAISAISNILFSIFLGFSIGFSGLALATSISSFIQLILLFFYLKGELSLSTRGIPKIILINLVMFMFFSLKFGNPRIDLVADIAGGAIIYISLLFLFKIEEVQKILHMISTPKST